MFRADDKGAPQYDFSCHCRAAHGIAQRLRHLFYLSDLLRLWMTERILSILDLSQCVICLNAYPSVATDSKYILSMESYEALVGNDDD